MGQSLSSIRDFIDTDVARGKVIDVDAYCRHFEPLFPHFTTRKLRQEIIAAVRAFGGGAVMGLNETLPPDEPYEEGDLNLSR